MLVFLRPRLPVTSTYRARPTNMTFLRSPLFWVFQIFNVIQGLGYFLPANYLPLLAEHFGASQTLGALTVLILNLASIFGCITTGFLVDRYDVTTILIGISACASVTVLLCLGLSTTTVTLYIFGVLYGLTAGSYSTSWGGMVKEVQRRYEGTEANAVFGYLLAGRGIGSIVSGPLSGALIVSRTGLRDSARTVFESQYSPIVILSGCTALLGGCSWFVRKAGLI